ncbi:hypothetical protein C2S52_012558 [Perilla frutescens var. hirtella]|nr:hypothetical protein C2S52_012558 [Perilla frutescens var. hirtella]
MATTRNRLFILAMLMLIILLSLDFTAAQIGVAYGRNGQGLPSASEVVNIYKTNGIKRMRIYDPYPPTLQALGGSGIELTVGAPNDQLQYLSNRANADVWVRDNIQKYPNVNFKHVVVGNEVSPRRNAQYMQYVVPAMRNIHDALTAAGLGRISVTTAVETDLIQPGTDYPPSRGEFRGEVKPYMQSVLQFLVSTNAPLFVNIYPYFAYVYSGGAVPLPYALLEPNSGVTTPDGVYYDNLYYALLDVMYSALEKSGVSSVSDSGVTNTEIKGSESGWPSAGGTPPAAAATDSLVSDQGGAAANPGNAGTYIRNLIRVVKRGTPKRPNRPIETYIFAMFDENEKPGAEDERHFGIFQPNGQSKYGPITFN